MLFSRKRFSRWGAGTAQLLGLLEATAGHGRGIPEAELEAAIGEGQELWRACRDLAHGSGSAELDPAFLQGRLSEWRMTAVSLVSARARPSGAGDATGAAASLRRRPAER